jgi:hypothetical protein
MQAVKIQTTLRTSNWPDLQRTPQHSYTEKHKETPQACRYDESSAIAENRFLGHDQTMPGPGYWLDPQDHRQDDRILRHVAKDPLFCRISLQLRIKHPQKIREARTPQITPEYNGTPEAASEYINPPIRPRPHFLPHQRYHLHKKRTSYETILFTDRRIPKSYSL